MNMEAKALPKYEREDAGSAPAPSARPAVALLPAGGALWEDFLDTIGVSLERFCSEGPGGWMLGYMDALDRVGMRTVLIFFSAKVDRPTRYRHSTNGNLITVLPVPAHYRALRRRLSGYVAGPARAVGPHLSTPLMALARELRREECRVILCQEYEYFRFDACVALGRLLRLPVFATFQGSDFEHNPLSRAVKAAVIRRSAGLLIAPSTEIERVHQAYGSNGPRVFQVFNPVDADEWGGGEREEARRALGLGAGTRVAVWHGRVAIHSKGLDLLLDAWERVCKERSGGDLRLMLIGTGQDSAEFSQRIAAMSTDNVHWINEYVTSRASIRRFLAAGDVYLFPSRLEGFAVAPIEAMACGLPIVAADASGVPDIFQHGEADGGLVVPREDVDAFAAAAGQVLDNPAYGVMLGHRARRRVEQAFSLDAVGRQLRAAILADSASAGRVETGGTIGPIAGKRE